MLQHDYTQQYGTYVNIFFQILGNPLGIGLYYRAMGKKVRVTIVRVVDVTEMGRAGGKATAANRTPGQRIAAAQKAIRARWEAYYKVHPEKLKAKLEREARERRSTKKRGEREGSK